MWLGWMVLCGGGQRHLHLEQNLGERRGGMGAVRGYFGEKVWDEGVNQVTVVVSEVKPSWQPVTSGVPPQSHRSINPQHHSNNIIPHSSITP